MSSPKASWQAKWVMTGLAVLLVLSVPVAAGRGVRKASGQFITFLQQFGDEEPAQSDTSQTIGSEPLIVDPGFEAGDGDRFVHGGEGDQ